NNICYSNGDSAPGNVCQRCTAAVNNVAWSSSPNTVMCAAADTCFQAAYCNGSGSCSNPALKQDNNESNNSESSATSIGNMANECDDQGKSGTGILSGSSDVDWYSSHGANDSSTCTVDPFLSVYSGGVNVRACLYLKCDNGDGGSLSCNDSSAGN